MNELFKDPTKISRNVNTLYQRAQEMGLKITKTEITKFLQGKHSVQVHKAPRRPTHYNSWTARYPRHIYQMDIKVMNKHEFRKIKYILVVIDVYSRYVSARVSKTRNHSELIPIFISILEEMGAPKHIYCDNEFASSEFARVAENFKFIYNFSDVKDPHKNPIVERFNRTIQEQLALYRSTTGDNNWPAVLPAIIKNYNTSIHRTIKHTPIAIWTGVEVNEQDVYRIPMRYKIGSLVRTMVKKKIFDKSDVRRNSNAVFRISAIEGKKYRLVVNDTGVAFPKRFTDFELSPVFSLSQTTVDNTHIDAKIEKRDTLVKTTHKVKNELKKIDTLPVLRNTRRRRVVIAPVRYKPSQ